MRLNIIILINTLILILTTVAYGQIYSPVESIGASQFSQIKASIEKMLKENKALETRYQLLKKRVWELQQAVDQNITKVESLDSRPWSETRAEMGYTVWEKPDGKVNEEKERNLLTEKNRGLRNKQKLIHLEESINLMNLKLTELRYMKREVEMDLNVKKMQMEKHQQSGKDEVFYLKSKIEANKNKEKDIYQEILEIEQGKDVFPEKAERLREENKELKEQIDELQRKTDFKIRENKNLEDRKTLVIQTYEEDFLERNEEHSKSKEVVDALQREYDELNKMVGDSKGNQNRRKKTLEQLTSFGKEYENLRANIEELKKKIEFYKRRQIVN